MNKYLSDKDIVYRRSFSSEEINILTYLLSREIKDFQNTGAISWVSQIEHILQKIERINYG